MLTDIKIIPEKLKVAREESSLSLTKAGQSVGVSRQRMWDYENGRCDCPVDVFARLCTLYEKPVEFFI